VTLVKISGGMARVRYANPMDSGNLEGKILIHVKAASKKVVSIPVAGIISYSQKERVYWINGVGIRNPTNM